MREMWDYESWEPFSGKTKDVSEIVPEKSKNIQSISNTINIHEVDQCPHERKFSLGIKTTSSDTKDRFPNSKSRSVDYSKPQWRQLSIWRPAQSVNGRTNLIGHQHTRNKLTPENLLELGPRERSIRNGM